MRGLSGAEIKSFIGRFCPAGCLKGVSTIDCLQRRKLKDHELIVVNSAKSTDSEGIHWLVCSCFHGKIEIYDCLANINVDYILKHFGHLGESFTFLDQSTMSRSENLCGHFCCYFISARLFNPEIPFDILCDDIFETSHAVNSRKVLEFLINEYKP